MIFPGPVPVIRSTSSHSRSLMGRPGVLRTLRPFPNFHPLKDPYILHDLCVNLSQGLSQMSLEFSRRVNRIIEFVRVSSHYRLCRKSLLNLFLQLQAARLSFFTLRIPWNQESAVNRI